MLGSKQIDKVICIACNDKLGEHSKNGLARCLFRIQGSYIDEHKPKKDTVLQIVDSTVIKNE